MIKTTLPLDKSLHLRLLLASKAERQSLSAFIRALLEQALARYEQKHLESLYAAMEELMGIATTSDPTVSTSIDEILYGEHGVWRGSEG